MTQTSTKARALFAQQKKNRGGPLLFADPADLVWNEARQTVIPAELAELPDDHFEPFRTPRWSEHTGRFEPAGAACGWRLTSKGRAAFTKAMKRGTAA
jgi:hypothetical protein